MKRRLFFACLCLFVLLAHAAQAYSINSANWSSPDYSYTTTGNTNASQGYLLTEEHLNRVIRVNETVGGWTRMYAPVDGDYSFTVDCSSLSGSHFAIRIYRNGTQTNCFHYYESGADLVTQTITDVSAGELISWWEDDETGRGYTSLVPFSMMVSCDNLPEPDHNIVANAPVGLQIGNLFYYGRFEQDNFLIDGKEDIVWRIIDRDAEKGLVLALSEYGLYTMKYHRNNNQTAWGNSDVRTWLNSSFLDSFTNEERQNIVNMTVSGSLDTAFLLDMDQIQRYLNSPYLCFATPWALGHGEQGAYINNDTGASSWLVRTDTAKKRIAFVGGGGMLYSPTGKKGVNYLTSKDNVVRPAIWLREEAVTRPAALHSFPLYAKTLMKISTRSGPTTGYNGLGDYFKSSGQIVRVLSRKFDGSIWWLEIEFEYKDALVRCYTGLKRVDIDISIVPDDTASFLGTGTVVGDVTAYYGPGTMYKHQVAKYTPADGTVGSVVKEENGWFCLEYDRKGEKVRVWLPPENLMIN